MEEHFRPKEAFVANIDIYHISVDGLVHKVLELLWLHHVSLVIYRFLVVTFVFFQHIIANIPVFLFDLSCNFIGIFGLNFSPRSLSICKVNWVISLPANGMLFTQLPITYPSQTGNTWVTPSPESMTVPVKSLLSTFSTPISESGPAIYAKSARVAYTPMKRPLTLNVSNIISAICSLFSGVFIGGSVKTKRCCSGSQRK